MERDWSGASKMLVGSKHTHVFLLHVFNEAFQLEAFLKDVMRLVFPGLGEIRGQFHLPEERHEVLQLIVQKYYDHPTARHPGELQTFNVVKEHYWWPGLQIFVKNYVQGCGTCQQFKIDRNLTKPAFIPLEGAKST